MGEEISEKSALVPRLRFPEFREAWVSSPMSELYSFKGNNSLSRDKLNYEGGSLRNIHYGDIHTKFALHFRADVEPVPYLNDGESHSTIRPENYCMAGDMVFADASEDMADIGKAIEIIDVGDVPLVSGLHTILARPNEGSFALGFGAYLFSSEGVRKQIQREGQGAKVLGLSATRLGNVKLHYPRKSDEQQKIADCLSSLDELITAEIHALTALKTHKKGLMQQLFPREGETVPRLRFPEFREAGEWSTKRLDSVGRVIRGASPRPKDDPRYYGGPVPRLMVQDVTRDGKWVTPQIDSLTLEGAKLSRPCTAGTLTIVCSGTVGVVSFLAVDACIHDGFLALIDIDESIVSKDFLFHSLSTLREQFEKGATHGGVFTNLTTSGIEQFEISCPSPPEQQRISDCFTAIDDLITAQSKKIDALKSHKNGLMQQLFPVLDEAQA